MEEEAARELALRKEREAIEKEKEAMAREIKKMEELEE